MKFTKLTLQGFGPFRAKQVIDFAALGEHGLFMISGPTGAGKSAILDAICFALYGETTSQGQGSGAVDGREAKELRCLQCEATDPTEVELEFNCGGVQYKVTRNPTYERASSRGGSLTQEKAKAALAVRSEGKPSEWKDVASRKMTEVNDRIQNATGLTVEQFRRVIILPQGRFRDVLIADYNTREEMLKRIFGTEIYERFEQSVEARFKKSRADCDAHLQRLTMILQTQPWAEMVDRTVVDAAAAKLLDSSRVSLEGAEGERTAVSAALATKNQALGEAKELTMLVQNVLSAKSARETALQQSSDAAPRRTELIEARSAALPKEKLGSLHAQSSELKKSLAAQPTAIAASTTAQEQLAATTVKKDAAESAYLGVAPMQVEIGELNARLAALERQRAMHKAAATAREQAWKETTKAVAAHTACEAAVKMSEEKLATDEAQLRNASAQFAHGVAARLARDLADDAPCPVCGSSDHPNLAQSAAETIEQDVVDDLTRELESQRADVDRAQKQFATAAVARATAETDLSAKESILNQLGALEDGSALTATRESLLARIASLDADVINARTAHDLGTHNAATAQQAVAASHADIARLQKSESAARDAFAESLTESALPNEDAVVKAWRSNSAIGLLEKELKTVDVTLQKCVALHEAFDKQLAGRSAPNIQGMQVEVDALNERAKSADAIIATHTARVHELTQFRENFARALTDLTSSEARSKTDDLLHGIVSGRSGASQRLSFHAWVLGSVLDRVLATASEMMRPLSNGRYELVRGDGTQDKRGAAGLDIEVHDHHSQQQRAARTLSGGETFLASLSLALALAEVAQAYHGARPLDTVFIDEGFGALDSDSLDTAMKALTTLHSKGRIVGIISHVEEVKRQIPHQLHVTRDPITRESNVI